MDILSFTEKRLMLERLVIGLEEPILVKGLGTISAKIDSGNGGYNVIHGEDFVQQGDTLLFTTRNDDGETRKLSKKIVDFLDVNIGGGNIQHRPVIELDIKFADTDYKKIRFTVTDRGSNDTLVLISKAFVQDELDALIDVGKTNLTKDGSVEAEIVTEMHFAGDKFGSNKTPTPNPNPNKKEQKDKSSEESFSKRLAKKLDDIAYGRNGATLTNGVGKILKFTTSITTDGIRSLLRIAKKDPIFQADKDAILRAVNQKAKEIESDKNDAIPYDRIKKLGITKFEIRRILDFSGEAWTTQAGKEIRGEARMGDRSFSDIIRDLIPGAAKAAQEGDTVEGDTAEGNSGEQNKTPSENTATPAPPTAPASLTPQSNARRRI